MINIYFRTSWPQINISYENEEQFLFEMKFTHQSRFSDTYYFWVPVLEKIATENISLSLPGWSDRDTTWTQNNLSSGVYSDRDWEDGGHPAVIDCPDQFYSSILAFSYSTDCTVYCWEKNQEQIHSYLKAHTCLYAMM